MRRRRTRYGAHTRRIWPVAAPSPAPEPQPDPQPTPEEREVLAALAVGASPEVLRDAVLRMMRARRG